MTDSTEENGGKDGFPEGGVQEACCGECTEEIPDTSAEQSSAEANHDAVDTDAEAEQTVSEDEPATGDAGDGKEPAGEENTPDYQAILEENGRKLDGISDSIRSLSADVQARMVSQDIMQHFDGMMRSQIQEMTASSTKSILSQIADLRERLNSILSKMRESKDSVTVDTAIDNMDIFGDMLEELLIVNGFVPFSDDVGEPYTYPRHVKDKIVDTDDPGLNKKIACVHRNGYIYGEDVVIPQSVDVYRYVRKEE